MRRVRILSAEKMEGDDLSTRLQRLGLQHKMAVSLENTEPHYVLDLAAQQGKGEDSLLAASSSNYTVRLLSRCRLAQTNVLTGHEDVISAIRFLHMDPDLVLTASHDKTVRLWDPRTSVTKEVQQFKGENNTHCSFLSCDVNCADQVLCAGTDKTKDDSYLLFWDRRKSTLLGCYEDSHDDDVTQIHFHPSSEQRLVSGSTDGLVNVFDISETTEEDALVSTYNTEATVEKAGWCGPEANHVYCITHMVTWHVWDTEEDEDIEQVTDLTEKMEGKVQYLVDCIPAGTASSDVRLAAGTHSGDLHLLDLTDPSGAKVVRSLEGGHSDTVRCLHWDHQTETLVTGGEDSMLCLWSPNATGVEQVTPKQGKVHGKKVKPSKRSTPYSGSRR